MITLTGWLEGSSMMVALLKGTYWGPKKTSESSVGDPCLHPEWMSFDTEVVLTRQ